MSQQQAEAFITELSKNEKLERALYSILDSKFSKPMESDQQKKQMLKQIVHFAANQGYNFTTEEYKAVLKKKKMELSDEELETVAGGGAVYQTESTSWLHCI